VTDDEEAEIRYKAELIREKRQLIRNDAKMRKSALKNGALIPRSAKAKKLSEMETGLQSLGFDTTAIAERARSQSRGRSRPARGRSEGAGTEDGDAMDVDATPKERLKRALSRPRSESRMNRREDGVTNEAARTKAERMSKLGQKKMNRMARQGEADRHVAAAIPKHLVRFISVFLIQALANFMYSFRASVAMVLRGADRYSVGIWNLALYGVEKSAFSRDVFGLGPGVLLCLHFQNEVSRTHVHHASIFVGRDERCHAMFTVHNHGCRVPVVL